MSKYKVYISSTFLDLKDIRQRILNRIHFDLHDNFEFTKVMESMKGDGYIRSNVDVCRDNVMDADIYILLIGKRYGSYPDKYQDSTGLFADNTIAKKSYTELEYDAAIEATMIKRFLIYNVILTDQFFVEENMNSCCDFEENENDEKFKKYDSFIKKLKNDDTPTKTNSLIELNTIINNKLADAYFILNSIINLPIAPLQKASINRDKQYQYLKDPAKKIGKKNRVVSFIISTKGDEDEVDEFSLRMRNVLTPQETINKIEWVDANVLSNYIEQEEDEKMMDNILIETSFNIFNARTNFASFKTFGNKIKEKNIQNRYLGFKISIIESDETTLTEKFIRIIYKFIVKLNDVLEEIGFENNFNCLINLQGTESYFRKNISNFKVEKHDLGKLSDIDLEDIHVWLNEVISTKDVEFKQNFTKNQTKIVNQIFVDTKKFPLTYKQCLEYINTKTKKSE